MLPHFVIQNGPRSNRIVQLHVILPAAWPWLPYLVHCWPGVFAGRADLPAMVRGGAALALLALSSQAATAAHADGGAIRWVQDAFAISEWQGPWAQTGSGWAADAEKRYQEFADANFTVVLGGLDPSTAGGIANCTCVEGSEPCCGDTPLAVQARLCQKHGLKAVPGLSTVGAYNPTGALPWPAVARIDPAMTSNRSVFWGFDLKDEPSAAQVRKEEHTSFLPFCTYLYLPT